MKHKFLGYILTIVFVLAAVSVSAGAKVWSADEVPMVHLQDQRRYVCDPESLLLQAMRDSADVYLRRLHVECGVQPVFVVVSHVQNGDCFRMAQDIGNMHGVGTSKERRGLVVVIAVGDRRYFIAPGKGLEGDLTDIESSDIGRACIVANMRVNDIEGAVLSTSKALFQKLKTGKTGIGQIDGSEQIDGEEWLPIILFLIICFGGPLFMLVRHMLETFGIVKKRPEVKRRRRRDDDDWMPPFIFGGGGGFGGPGGGFSGGSFGGGSFGGGGAGGGW